MTARKVPVNRDELEMALTTRVRKAPENRLRRLRDDRAGGSSAVHVEAQAFVEECNRVLDRLAPEEL
jgi:hypothetical protein